MSNNNRAARSYISNNPRLRNHCFGNLFLLMIFMCFVGCATTSSRLDIPSDYVQNVPENKKVIIFVHGIIGNAVQTWSGGDKKKPVFWPEMMAKDREFKDYNIYAFSYYTPAFNKALTIPELSVQLNNELIVKEILPKGPREQARYNEIIFVAHSMGNLVVRQALQDKEAYQNTRVRLLISLAAPSAGAEIANIAKNITPNTTVAEMSELDHNAFLISLNQKWRTNHPEVEIACGYETLDFQVNIPIISRVVSDVIGRVVSMASATYMCTREPYQPLTGDHSQIVKPYGIGDPIYQWVRTEIQKPQTRGKRYSVILMDNPVLSYDEKLRNTGLMNSHQIRDALSDLPLNMCVEPINATTEFRNLARIAEVNPDLIIIHLSGLNDKPLQDSDQKVNLRVFLNVMKQTKTKFIIYTRWKPKYGPLDDTFFDKILGDMKGKWRPRIKLLDVRRPAVGGRVVNIVNPSFGDPAVQNSLHELVKELLIIP